VDAGAIPPLLRTFLMGIPELRAHLEATATEGEDSISIHLRRGAYSPKQLQT